MTERFGRYILEDKIGNGNMGVIFRARDTEADNRRVALKLLPPGISNDIEYRKRFEREAQMPSTLKSPHIVEVHSAGEIEGRLYIDMPLLAGVDLQARLERNGKPSTSEALRIVSEVAEALDDAHAQNLIHRDVKPSNIFIHESGHTYLIDFGIAYRDGETYTMAGLGTAEYMAPERYDNVSSPQVDVYSLTCVLFELIVGSSPFAGNMLQQFKAHNSAARPKPSSLDPSIPSAFDDVIARGMAIDPSKRYKSAGDLAAAAKLALAQQRGRPQPSPRPPLPPPPPSKWKKPAILALVLVVGFSAWFFSRPPEVAAVNPGASFEGTYEVQYTMVSRGNETVSNAEPSTSNWQVRSHCAEVNGPCVASIQVSDAGAETEARYGLVADYNDGEWLINVRIADDADACGVDQPAVRWNETTFKPDENETDFSGFADSYFDGNCNYSEKFVVTVRRLADVDPSVPFESVQTMETRNRSSLGYAFDGKYSYTTTPTFSSRNNNLSAPASGKVQVKAICLRNSDTCTSVGKFNDSDNFTIAWNYNAGTWLATGAYETACYTSGPNPRAQMNYEQTQKKTGGDLTQAATLSGTMTRFYGEPCAGEFRYTQDLQRIGD
ncbi:hypothetical protein BJF84_10435 [Rhodococcus sp. CUA-806]|nr:hypothetical protein BJF84_10435 [Rhodococcus sp. CUA-806]